MHGKTLFEDARGLVASVAFSPDGQTLATGEWDRTIRLSNTETWAFMGSPVQGHGTRVKVLCLVPTGFGLYRTRGMARCVCGTVPSSNL